MESCCAFRTGKTSTWYKHRQTVTWRNAIRRTKIQILVEPFWLQWRANKRWKTWEKSISREKGKVSKIAKMIVRIVVFEGLQPMVTEEFMKEKENDWPVWIGGSSTIQWSFEKVAIIELPWSLSLVLQQWPLQCGSFTSVLKNSMITRWKLFVSEQMKQNSEWWSSGAWSRKWRRWRQDQYH